MPKSHILMMIGISHFDRECEFLLGTKSQIYTSDYKLNLALPFDKNYDDGDTFVKICPLYAKSYVYVTDMIIMP
jgi:hypothetical protein